MRQKTPDELLEEHRRHADKPRPYTPDHRNLLAENVPGPAPSPAGPPVSPRVRVGLVLLALAATGYGAYGVIVDDLFLPAKGRPGTHYHGAAAQLFFLMFLCFSGWLLAQGFARRGRPGTRRLGNWLLAATVLCMLAGIAVG